MARPTATRLTRAAGRAFAFPVGGAFVVLGGVAAWRGNQTAGVVLGTLGMALLLAGIVAPSRLGYLQSKWMELSHAIARVTTPVFLAIVYFLVITPVALVMRATGRNPVRHRAMDGSYWKVRGNDRGGMRNQF